MSDRNPAFDFAATLAKMVINHNTHAQSLQILLDGFATEHPVAASFVPRMIAEVGTHGFPAPADDPHADLDALNARIAAGAAIAATRVTADTEPTPEPAPTQDWAGYFVEFDAANWPEAAVALGDVELKRDDISACVDIEVAGNSVNIEVEVSACDIEDDLRYDNVNVGLTADNLLDLLVRSFNEGYDGDEDKRADAHGALCAELLRRLNA